MVSLRRLVCLFAGLLFIASRAERGEVLVEKHGAPGPSGPAHGAKDVLIMGNTGLLGENLERAICSHGHKITVVARRQVPTQPCSTLVVADRLDATELSAALEGRGPFDSVVDNSAFNPESVSILMGVLSSGSGQLFGGLYFLVSSISGCTGFVAAGEVLQEDDCDTGSVAEELDFMEEHDPEELLSRERRGESYGVRKLAMERQILELMPRERVIIVEPSYIIGAGDDRAKLLPYWIMRLSTGEPVLVPLDYGDTIQFTDAQPTAMWIADLINNPEPLADVSGVPRYFVATPPYTVSQILGEIETMLRSEGAPPVKTVTWTGQGSPRMPLLSWAEGKVDVTRATRAGLNNRALVEIVREIYHQWAAQGPPFGEDGWLSGEFWRGQTPNADPLKNAMTRSEELDFMMLSQ